MIVLSPKLRMVMPRAYTFTLSSSSRSRWPSLGQFPSINPSLYPLGFLSIRFLSASSTRQSESPSFSYHISASYSAKQHQLHLSRNLYSYNPFHRVVKATTDLSPEQRKSKRPRSGQDAFFVSNIADTGSVAFGVVDGVGGWVESGVDPADFSHSICEYMASVAATYPKSVQREDSAVLQPVELLQFGYERVMEDKSVDGGGSTACIATASPNGILEVANLGDSGYVHISPFRLSHISDPQTHAFNTPYQLSKIPSRVVAQLKLFAGVQHHSELPSDADRYSHSLTHGDILVFATDGVWDNLSPEDVLRIASHVMVATKCWIMGEEGAVSVNPEFTNLAGGFGEDENGEPVVGLGEILAMAITREAKEASLNKKRDGPFAKEVKRRYPMEDYRGGKPDDICTVVAVAVEEGL